MTKKDFQIGQVVYVNRYGNRALDTYKVTKIGHKWFTITRWYEEEGYNGFGRDGLRADYESLSLDDGGFTSRGGQVYLSEQAYKDKCEHDQLANRLANALRYLSFQKYTSEQIRTVAETLGIDLSKD